ncbi:hypothetical protein KDK_57460 [Dictyobacter kobayashii]|uniref:Uncharacterized protein n=1 Tax=Dictyobacter kobayashii TaxID=2014872 RepID=A0A402AS71_9CHLR|nr:hypothetical protein KDK_57460 [Dictyobacter kobayashii]
MEAGRKYQKGRSKQMQAVIAKESLSRAELLQRETSHHALQLEYSGVVNYVRMALNL